MATRERDGEARIKQQFLMAAPVKKRPAITGVSSATAVRGRFGRTDRRGAVSSFLLTGAFSFGDSALAAGFSLSLILSGVIAQKLAEH